MIAQHAKHVGNIGGTSQTPDAGSGIKSNDTAEIKGRVDGNGFRELLKQEARDLILFSVSPGPHRRISHSNICEVDEKRLRELGPAIDFNRVGSVEIYFYSS